MENRLRSRGTRLRNVARSGAERLPLVFYIGAPRAAAEQFYISEADLALCLKILVADLQAYEVGTALKRFRDRLFVASHK